MGAPNEYYVDPSIAAASGAGTIGDPWGDLQHALDNITRDSSDGDRVNVKAGTDEILSAAIDLATYGSPSQFGPLIIQGYTSVAGDGGVGGVSGNGSVAIVSSAPNGVALIDMHLHNCGSAAALTLGNDIYIFRCEVDNTSGLGITISGAAIVRGNNIHNIGGVGLDINGPGIYEDNYFANGTNDFSACIDANGEFEPVIISRNIMSIDGASDGIVNAPDGLGTIKNNSILSAGGTGTGIQVNTSSELGLEVINNLVEGFSGTGGIGIDYTNHLVLLGANAVYNCATAYDGTASVSLDLGDNETLGASPFAKSGADTFANRLTYFAPVDTGNVFGGAYQ